MDQFTNVTVVKKANIYFDGAVTSRTVQFGDGTKKTLGIMLPGEYTFNTGVAEIMEILAGDLQYRVGDSGDWKAVTGGESFQVPSNSAFTMKVATVSDYCCSFLPE
ncbi:pyrimidine/purine nucleoside phosphorylase [Geobacter pelophilus]|uniref:Pyrimidine/purine nucleoside phosphorylase n=1 Tax=Geoanaerobacter pelophilus TaxID=60036 RepID=A0AAW4KZY1_9BACT|nr:pyrimidine/purine nucleoside phosphorylase [Geoanaerobacter pelophilus]MBT0664354.1 pyrimidine/purine nucleoside phosphorylase [Geoanaerobacter pelophilus]